MVPVLRSMRVFSFNKSRRKIRKANMDTRTDNTHTDNMGTDILHIHRKEIGRIREAHRPIRLRTALQIHTRHHNRRHIHHVDNHHVEASSSPFPTYPIRW